MVHLTHIRLTKGDLERIPADERFFYLMAGHLGNDTNILGQLLLTAHNTAFELDGTRRKGPTEDASLTQFLSIMKIMAGRLHEANKLVSVNYFGMGLHKKYEKELPDPAKNSLRQLGSYFGSKSNIITEVRNKFAFHHTRKNVEDIYDIAPNDFPYEIYLGEYSGHNLFYGSEIIMLNAMAALVKAPTPVQSIEKIFGDIVSVTDWLSLFLRSYIQLIIKLYLNPLQPNQIQEIEMEDPPSISEYKLPFFSAPPEH